METDPLREDSEEVSEDEQDDDLHNPSSGEEEEEEGEEFGFGTVPNVPNPFCEYGWSNGHGYDFADAFARAEEPAGDAQGDEENDFEGAEAEEVEQDRAEQAEQEGAGPTRAKGKKKKRIPPEYGQIKDNILYVVLDFETSSSNKTRGSLIQIGACMVNKSFRIVNDPLTGEMYQFKSYIKPRRSGEWIAAAESVHHISKTTANAAPTLREVWRSFIRWIEKVKKPEDYVCIVGHNAFACEGPWLAELSAESRKAIELPDYFLYGLDTYWMAKDNTKAVKQAFENAHKSNHDGYTLSTTYFAATNQVLVNAHDALADAIATAEVLTSGLMKTLATKNRFYFFMKDCHEKILEREAKYQQERNQPAPRGWVKDSSTPVGPIQYKGGESRPRFQNQRNRAEPASALHIFKNFITDEMIQELARSSTDYAMEEGVMPVTPGKRKKFQPCPRGCRERHTHRTRAGADFVGITPASLKVFFGVLLLCGVYKPTTLRRPWSKECGIASVKGCMTQKAFLQHIRYERHKLTNK